MIVFPMAGESRRFREAGYDRPKFMLEAHGKSLFRHAVEGFARYFESEPLLFIARDSEGAPDFVRGELAAMGVRDYRLVLLDAPTGGQAETVVRGLEGSSEDGDFPITIFNIDTFRPGFHYPSEFSLDAVDGYLETFIGSGPNWSNIEPDPGRDWGVARTAEKQEISEFCCTGLYYWRSAERFRGIYEADQEEAEETGRETESYVAPLFNHLIADGGDVRYTVIPVEDVIFCGVPAEYEAFLVR